MDAGHGSSCCRCGLVGRSIGVFISLIASELDLKERIFVAISYCPKATVQAAIGASPLLAMQKAGMPDAPGQLILAISVLSIILTAPLGAVAVVISAEAIMKTSTPTTKLSKQPNSQVSSPL